MITGQDKGTPAETQRSAEREPSPIPRHPPRRPGWGTMLGVWVVVFLAVWVAVRAGRSSPLLNPDAKPKEVAPRGDLGADERSTIEVFRNASPSVVYITNIEYRRPLFSMKVFEIPKGSGSGFIWDTDGHIVTNYHVIAGANAIEVTLADHSSWPARFVGGAPDKDLAVVKIDAPRDRLRALPIGTSSDLQVGQKVLAIGNPFGFDQTLTTGVVSALGREITSLTGRPIKDVIQTDAAINPGNSGGPLLDSAGRLIGVNTQIASPSGTSAGIGFAVPVDTVNRVVPQIIRYGRVIRPGLGILPLQDAQARLLDIAGVLVLSVSENSGAEAAGLRGTILSADGRQIRQLGDVIIAVDDTPIRSLNDLLDVLEMHEVGDSVRVTAVRDDAEVTVVVRLQAIN